MGDGHGVGELLLWGVPWHPSPTPRPSDGMRAAARGEMTAHLPMDAP